MDEMREKLVELLKTNACPSPFMCDPTCRYYGYGDCFPDRFADYLIANGVTVADGKDTEVHTGWTPASEPPKVYRDEYGVPIPFLAYTEDENLFITYLVDGKHWGRFGQDLKVTHWRHLPVPPKGK